MTWIVIHRASGPNLVCGPFLSVEDMHQFMATVEDYYGVSLFDTLGDAMVDREATFADEPAR